jgi:hypothetical protein
MERSGGLGAVLFGSIPFFFAPVYVKPRIDENRNTDDRSCTMFWDLYRAYN